MVCITKKAFKCHQTLLPAWRFGNKTNLHFKQSCDSHVTMRLFHIFCRSMISDILNSMRNTYGTLPRDKVKFMLAVLDCDIKLLHSPGKLSTPFTF